jgi:hypothetical protein
MISKTDTSIKLLFNMPTYRTINNSIINYSKIRISLVYIIYNSIFKNAFKINL